MEQGSWSPLKHLLKRLELGGKSKSGSHMVLKKIQVSQTGQSKFVGIFNLHTLFTYKVTEMLPPCPALQVHYLMIPT